MTTTTPQAAPVGDPDGVGDGGGPAAGTAPTGSGDGGIDRQVLKIAGVVIVGAIMAILDITIVNVALNRLAADFDAPLSTIQWVVTGYTLALVAVIPLTGWAADRFGTKRLYMAAIGLFVLGSGLAGAAQTVEMLIIFRVLQGLGGGMIMPLVLTMLTRAAGPGQLGRVMSVIGVPMLLGPVTGPILGGWLVDDVSWRAIFYINLPVGIVALILAVLVLPRDEPISTQRLDVAGLLLLSPGLAAFVYGAAQAASHGGIDSAAVYTPAGIGLALIVGFVVRALTARHPLIDLRLFGNRAFAVSAGSMLLFATAFFGALLLLPLYFQTLRREGALDAGLLLAPQGLGAMVTMPIAGRLTDRIGPGRLVVPGLVVLIAAMGFFTQIGAQTSYWVTSGALFVTGLGMGMTMMPIMTSAMSSLADAAVARASTTMNIIQQTGASIGTAMLSVVLASELADRLPANDGGGLGAAQAVPADLLAEVGPSIADAFGATFVVAVALLAVAMIPALLLPRRALSAASVAVPAASPGPTASSGRLAAAQPEAAPPQTSPPPETSERSVTDTPPGRPTPPTTANGTRSNEVRVRVIDAGAHAVAETVLTLVDHSGATVATATTDAVGAARFTPPAPGGYVLVGVAPGYLPRASRVTVHDEPVDVEFDLQARAGAATDTRTAAPHGTGGLVTATAYGHPTGTDPAAEPTVIDAAFSLLDEQGRVLAHGPARPDGKFTATAPAPGSYTITASATGHLPVAAAVTVHPSGPVHRGLVLRREAVLHGQVLAGCDGPPLPGALVSVRDAAGRTLAATDTGTDGRYQVTGLPEGEYAVTVTGFPARTGQVPIRAGHAAAHDVTLEHDRVGEGPAPLP